MYHDSYVITKLEVISGLISNEHATEAQEYIQNWITDIRARLIANHTDNNQQETDYDNERKSHKAVP
jgi:sensor histidine kinase regulating citrate/malate metabolism